jgi:membrane-bound metal-dependent hydrolase YbcI (DUF457 family)
MIFGHLPAGYITSKLLLNKFQNRSVNANIFIFWGMFGAIAPDIDLLYYLLMDPSQPEHHHHKYLTHFPIFWLALLLISLLWLRLRHRSSQNAASAVIFTLNGFIHIVLDTITGHIFWLAPFMDKPFSLIADSSRGADYFTHWTFGFEIFLIFFALFVWLASSMKNTKQKNSIT